MDANMSQRNGVLHNQDPTAESNHGAEGNAVTLHGGSETSSRRHRRRIERHDAAACLAPPMDVVVVRSASNAEAPSDAARGGQLGVDAAASCASTAEIYSAPGHSYVVSSARTVINIQSYQEDTASPAASTSGLATNTSGKRKRSRTCSVSMHVPGGSYSAAHHSEGPQRSKHRFRGKLASGKRTTAPRQKTTVSVSSPGVLDPLKRATVKKMEDTIQVFAPSQTFFGRDGSGDSVWGGNSKTNTNAATATGEMLVLDAPGTSREMSQADATTPTVLTLIVGEYIIQESSEPFPIDYQSPIVGPVSSVLFLDTYENVESDGNPDKAAVNSSPERQEVAQNERPSLSPAHPAAVDIETNVLVLAESLPDYPRTWTIQDVERVRDIPGCAYYAEKFSWHEIDGAALLLLTMDQLVTTMDIKLGPAVKIWDMINTMRERR